MGESIQHQWVYKISMCKMYPNSHKNEKVYIPSLSIDPEELEKVDGFIHYEERPFLACLLSLRDPARRLAFVTSVPLPPEVLDYYLKLSATKDVSVDSIRERLLLLSTNDTSSGALTSKILQAPELVQRLRGWVQQPDSAYMECPIPSKYEFELAKELNLPLAITSPECCQKWGTKNGSRTAFEEAGIPFPDGCLEVFSTQDLMNEIVSLWKKYPHHHKYVVKLNDGVAGDGNAVLHLEKEADGLSDEEMRTYIEKQLKDMDFVSSSENWKTFEEKGTHKGFLVEMWVEGENVHSPSAQALIRDEDDVMMLSTHEQILDKEAESEYLGCYFPADRGYRQRLQEYCQRVGEVLAKNGARDRFAIDFVVTENVKEAESHYNVFAIEINLRSGGTTYPYEAARALCNATLDANGALITADGNERCYRASENVKCEFFEKLSYKELFEAMKESGVEWNEEEKKGCVFYFLGGKSDSRKVGVLSIADSRDEASRMYKVAKHAIVDRAKQKQ